MKPRESRTPEDVVRRLMSSGASDANGVSVAHGAFERVYAELARWVGPTGAHTLLARSVAESAERHPLLLDLKRESLDSAPLGDVAQLVKTHDATKVAAALSAVLVTAVELLTRLVGGEMAYKLVEQSPSAPAMRDERSDA